MWPVGLVLAPAFVFAVMVAAAVFLAAWDLLGARELKPERRIESKTLFALVKLSSAGAEKGSWYEPETGMITS
ncbi:hypothetical protein [Streptomyces sp. NPDC029674]|uniref:hypothetical protein n=1 Tax=Streptomyces sp. NPDC029674 TaxID=3365297 RepID=UPI00384E8B20